MAHYVAESKVSLQCTTLSGANGGRQPRNHIIETHLLECDESSTLGWRCNLRNVDRDLGTLDPHAEAVDDAPSDQHADVLGGTDDGTADDPNDTTNHDTFLATKDIRQES